MFDIAKAREICDKATQGPWFTQKMKPIFPSFLKGEDMWEVYSGIKEMPESVKPSYENCEFISEARTLLPQAIAEIEHVVGRLVKALKILDEVADVLVDIDPRRTDLIEIVKMLEEFDPGRYCCYPEDDDDED